MFLFVIGYFYMVKIFLVGLGGFIGALLRYSVGNYVQQVAAPSGFPYGTLVVNVVGCLVIGALGSVGELRDVFTPETRALVFVGLLGAFTTFSSFSYDTLKLFQDSGMSSMVANVGLQLVLGLSAVWAGGQMARWFLGS